jgi:hypothetical protein
MNSKISRFLHSQLRRTMLFVSSTLPVDPLDAMLPINPAINDLNLVSYPKSGSTWLAFMLGKVNLLMSGIDRWTTLRSPDRETGATTDALHIDRAPKLKGRHRGGYEPAR